MRKTYALFDFDGTLIAGDSIILFMRYALKNKLCSVWDLFRFAYAGGLFTLRLLHPKRAKEIGLGFLAGRERKEYSAAAEDFCQNVLVPRLLPQGIAAVRKHQAAGHEVLLISASPAFYLEPLKRTLGFTRILGTRFVTDAAGRFTNEVLGTNCRGEQKTVRFKEYLEETGAELDYETSSAYGDSINDLPMLRLCKHAYAVNPGRIMRRKLKATGGITVVNWKEKP